MNSKTLKIRTITLLIAISILLPCLAAAQEGQQTGEIPLLVDTDWLENNLNLPELRIIDAGRTPEDYQTGHIPGAVFLGKKTVWDEVDGIMGMLPPQETVVQAFEDAGIGDENIVVLYDGSNGLWSSRFFWALEYLGHRNVHVLNGGWDRWVLDGREVSEIEPDIGPGEFTRQIRNEVLATREWILGNLDNPTVKIVDTRTPKEYSGEDVRAARGGHIPGAVNVNWVLNILAEEGGIFLPADELAELYDSREITSDDIAVTHCQTGVRGAHTYFVLRHLGYSEVKLYDGSWVEWGNREDTPLDEGEM